MSGSLESAKSRARNGPSGKAGSPSAAGTAGKTRDASGDDQSPGCMTVDNRDAYGSLKGPDYRLIRRLAGMW